MPPPARLRDHYVVGKIGSYLATSPSVIDVHLRKLRLRLERTGPAAHPMIWHDIDLLLERRSRMLVET